MATLNPASNVFDRLVQTMPKHPETWLITGASGFIGSNLLEALLKLDQKVVGLDNFSTGHRKNLDEVRALVTQEQWSRFRFVDGDICNLQDCRRVVENVDHVLHEAALGSVPRSLENPLATDAANIGGFLNMLVASRDAKVKSFTYAASSSTYGDHTALPKVEDVIGRPLSPYAVTKYVNELYADVFARSYGFNCIGLRYFNVFGPRQDPNGAYAAVIPKWTDAMVADTHVFINGDGETSRDYCYVENIVQANLLAAHSKAEARNNVYNVALGDRTSLTELFNALRSALARSGVKYQKNPVYRDFRAGDVRHSQADISKIVKGLGYIPIVRLQEGIDRTIGWYVKDRVGK